MHAACAQMAFLLPSGPEMLVILFVGILLFGRRLPEVGRTVGRTVAQLRQGLNKFKAELDMDRDIREVRDQFRDTRDDLTRAADVPRALGDPNRLLTELTDETLAAMAPTDVVSDVPADLFGPPAMSRGQNGSVAKPDAPA